MSKAKKPRRQQPTSTGKQGSDKKLVQDRQGEARPKIWNFDLERTTVAAPEAEVGEAVVATRERDGFLVSSLRRAALGWVPDETTSRILQSMEAVPEPRLEGEIVETDTGTGVRLKLIA